MRRCSAGGTEQPAKTTLFAGVKDPGSARPVPRYDKKERIRIAIMGQQDFGKAALEAFLARGDTVAGVFCAPEKEGAVLILRIAATQAGIPVFQPNSLQTAEARDACEVSTSTSE